MNEQNPYQAPQAALTSAAVPSKLQQLIPWDEEGRRVLCDVAKQHRWMMGLYFSFLLYGCCCMLVGYLAAEYLPRKYGDLIALQVIPLIFLYPALIYQVYQAARLLNKALTPLISLLVMLLFPYALVVPIFYHRRAVHFFAHFGIRLPLLGIRPTELDTQIAAKYDASLAQPQPSISDVEQLS